MEGRFENEIKINNNIQKLLNELPDYVSDFYYNIQTSVSPLTCSEYLGQIKRFLSFANKDVKDIDDALIGQYINEIRYSCGRRTSESYNKFVCTVLNRFFQYLYDKGIINSNPMRLIKRTKKKDNVQRIYLDMDDLNKILKSVMEGAGSDHSNKIRSKMKERDYAILFMLMVTGMRRTALSEINMNNIDFVLRKIYVVDKRNKLQVYDITDEMECALLAWMNKRQKILDENKETSDALFINGRCNRMTAGGIYNIVKKYSQEAIGKGVSPHKLRAAFASLYYEESGHDIEATRVAVGHEDISTTSIYINKNNNARKEAVNYMSKGLSKSN